jgi:hypothetical protein
MRNSLNEFRSKNSRAEPVALLWTGEEPIHRHVLVMIVGELGVGFFQG